MPVTTSPKTADRHRSPAPRCSLQGRRQASSRGAATAMRHHATDAGSMTEKRPTAMAAPMYWTSAEATMKNWAGMRSASAAPPGRDSTAPACHHPGPDGCRDHPGTPARAQSRAGSKLIATEFMQ